MRQDNIGIILLSVIMLIVMGCVSEPNIDKGKFSELNQTVQDLKAAITSGRPCDVPDKLLKRLASGVAVLKDKTTSKTEIDLIADYSNLLNTYEDDLLLCQSRTHLSEFQFVPKGRIYVFQELDPLIEKYGLPTERHVYKPTGQFWKSISEDSIKVILESAEVQTKNIENIMNYN